MSSVFLADVDDYLSPSTACVNPAFATGNGDSTTTTKVTASTAVTTTVTAAVSAPDQQSKTNHNGNDTIPTEGVVRRRPRNPVVARRTGQRGTGGSSSSKQAFIASSSNSNSNNKKVTASIVDCLACSGCVTTAETVLLKEHSVDKFREMLIRARTRRTRTIDANIDSSIDSIMEVDEEDEDEEDSARVVITLSIASAAELLRLLRRDNSSNNISVSTTTTAANPPLTLLRRKLASLLCRQLHVDAVLDGQLALEWSLLQSAVEFCERYQQQHHHQPADHISTLVSSSCPATVCYVEKTCHSAVPHLSHVRSPMGCARAYLSHPIVQHHVAVMPCHDKKLEATRPTVTSSTGSGDGDDNTTNSNNQNVLVLTTSDCWQLLLESIDADDDEDRAELLLLPAREDRLRRLFESLPPADVDRVTSTQDFEPRRQEIVPNSWITSDAGAHDDGDHVRGTAPSSSLLYTSGGYADYIFRFAAHRMFGTSLSHVEWNAVSASNALALSSSSPAPTMPVSSASSSSSSSIRARSVNTEGRPTTASARVAAARREILEATLYRHEYRRCSSSGSISIAAESVVVEYSQHEQPTCADVPDGSNESPSSLMQVSTIPVLRFAMAHGLQVMQRAISNAGSSDNGQKRYHYVEAMACPSGCLNGGGQVLLPSASSSSHQRDGRREPPSEVKARVESASRNLRPPHPPAYQDLPDPSLLQHPSSYRENLLNEQLQTSFHAVQPLQLQYGAAKGMAVKDIQW
jgi:iron only hydrogenase large subunit-like protein